MVWPLRFLTNIAIIYCNSHHSASSHPAKITPRYRSVVTHQFIINFMNRRKHRGNEKGYFIVEILVIVSVLALLVLSGFPHWWQWLEYQELRATGQSLMSYLHQGRSEAQRFNRDLLLIQGDRQQGCWLYFARNVTGLSKVPANSCWHPSHPNRTQLVLVGRPGFYGWLATAKAGSVMLTMGRNRIRIFISTRCRIRSSGVE